jgi:ResB-like family
VSRIIKQVLKPLASLRLTVLLFALSIVLIFVGTVAQKYEGNWAVVDRYFRSLWLMMPIGIAGIKVPFIGGYSLCILMLANLISAHYVRFKFTWKRSGILLTHAGLILLLSGELVTGLFAVEWRMPIDEGSSANYAEDIRVSELAIVDPSPKDHDSVVVVPQSVLASHEGGEPIKSELLPFDIQVLEWMPNAGLLGPMTAEPKRWLENPATDGFGKVAVALKIPKTTGVEGGRVDAPAAYLKLTREGEEVGTWLAPLHGIGTGDTRQPVTVDGKTYLIELRFKRDDKPYTLHLIDFRHDKFVGTEIPRNFSSEVRMVDPSRNSDFKALIYMNHPLRYGGETFYQSGYFGETRTILQVVRNPAWLLPYIACALVG